jgi:hypothetical protein
VPKVIVSINNLINGTLGNDLNQTVFKKKQLSVREEQTDKYVTFKNKEIKYRD